MSTQYMRNISISQKTLCELMKPLYALSDSENHWDETFRAHLTKYLGPESLTTDVSKYTWNSDNRTRPLGSYVDEIPPRRNELFLTLTEKKERFEKQSKNSR